MKLIKACLLATALITSSLSATEPHQLTAVNSARFIIGDKNAGFILFRGDKCFFGAEAKSRAVGEIDLTLISVTCDDVEKEVPMDDRITLSVTDVEVLRSSAVMGVRNELVKGTVIDGTPWMEFQF